MATPPPEGVNLVDLAASAVASSVWASRSIREVYDQRNTRLKEDGTFVTDADVSAQVIIVEALRQISSSVRVVGEESPEDMARHSPPEVSLDDPIYSLAQQEMRLRVSDGEHHPLPLASSTCVPSEGTYNVPAAENEEHQVDPSRVSVFVDPLDGTKSYAHGDFDSVSILIAIMLDNRPHFGVICKPFGYRGHTTVLDTECVAVYGGSLLGGVYIAGGKACSSIIRNEASLPRAVISQSRSKGIVEDFIMYLGSKGVIDSEPMYISGAGEKSLRLILGTDNEALWFFPKAGTSLWDVAASDALLRSLGGKVTDKFGNEMDYSKSRGDAGNDDGVIACNDGELHAECIRLFQEGDWGAR